MTKILLEGAGKSIPPIEHWIEKAMAGEWDELRDAFYRNTEELTSPETWSITLLEDDDSGLGIGIVIPGRLLLVPLHERGVTAIPLYAMPPETTYHNVLSNA